MHFQFGDLSSILQGDKCHIWLVDGVCYDRGMIVAFVDDMARKITS